MTDDLQVVLITGAGSGMGLTTALRLASSGYRVCGSVLSDAEAESIEAQARSRGLEIGTVRFDVTNGAEVEAGVAEVFRRYGSVDALVQFVGIGLRGFFEDLGLDEIERAFQVNVLGLMRVTQAVLPSMRKARRGRIILTSSIGGRMGSMSISGYASTKFAVEGWAECLRQELAPFGIWVSLLEPGLVSTPHFTVYRNRARRATDPSSPYYAWFCQHEEIVDKLLARNALTTEGVAGVVTTILASPRPRLRYVAGRKAKWIFRLRRYIPGEWFERYYWAAVRRMVTQPKNRAAGLSGMQAKRKS